MTKKENELSFKKSERIALQIAKANQIAAVELLHAILEEQIEPVRHELAALQAMNRLPETPVINVKAIEGPAKAEFKRKSRAVSSYWASMTAEQRSKEMKRRLQKRAKTEELSLAERMKLHPRDKRSPRHEQWIKTMTKAARRRFDSMSAREVKQWKAAMQQGRSDQAREQRINGAIQ